MGKKQKVDLDKTTSRKKHYIKPQVLKEKVFFIHTGDSNPK